MSLETAMRLTETFLALALLQQSIEHLRVRGAERRVFLARAGLCVLLALGLWAPFVMLALALVSLLILNMFQGPYNGGSDRMGLLAIFCLCFAHFLPDLKWREYAFGYLAAQLILSYFISGWVKIVNPDWRSGRALQDVFQFSVYPVSEGLRGLALRPKLLFVMSWLVMLFELIFPLTMLSPLSLAISLIIAGLFHLSNACLFGLNRFFWTWLAVYPSIIWLQHRVA